MNLLEKIKLFKSKKFNNDFDRTLENAISNSDENFEEEIIQNYLLLIQSLNLKKQNHTIKISNQNCFIITIDGQKYDFDLHIRHNQSKLTEAKMSIESLINETEIENIERKLNEYFS